MRRRELLAAGAAAVITSCAPAVARPTPRATALPALAANPAQGYWPSAIVSAPVAVREAYEFAVANRETLRWIPCYCGCGSHGDRDNFDCYVNEVRDGGWLVLDDHGLG